MIRCLIPAVVLAASAGTAIPAVPEVLEVARAELEPAFNPNSGHSIAFAPSGEALYAVSRSDLFVVDAEDGTVTELIDLRPILVETYRDRWQLTTSQWSGESFLVVSNMSEPNLHLYSLEDPRHPVYRRTISTLQDEVERVVMLENLPLAYALDYWGDLYSMVNGRRMPRPPMRGRPGWYTATALRSGQSVLAVYNSEHRPYPDPPRAWITTLAWTSTTRIRVWSNVEAPAGESVRGVMLSPDASLMVIGYYDYGGRTARYEIRDPVTGVRLASIAPPGNGTQALLAAGGRVLAVGDAGGMDLIDLRDPRAPSILGRVEAELIPGVMAASPKEPVVFAAAAREVLAIDVDTVSVVGRWDAAGLQPRRILVHRDASTTVRAAVLSEKFDGWDVLERGGQWRLDLLDVTNPAIPFPTGGLERAAPDDIEGFEVLGGRYGLVDDARHNTLLLFDLPTGEVVDSGGFFRRQEPSFPDWPYDDRIQVAGDWILGMSWRWYERMRVRDGRLEPHAAAVIDDTYVVYGVVRADGLVVLQTFADDLRTFLVDGRTGRLALPFRPQRMTLSPSGKRLLLELRGVWGEGALAVVDLSRPETPRLLWHGNPDVTSAQFLPGEDRLLVSADFEGWWSFRVAVYDAETGEPRGSPSEPVGMFVYHDRTVTFGSGPDTRAVFWKWTWFGWETVVFDVGTDTPRVLRVLPEFGGFPEYRVRGADRGWYEWHVNYWGGVSRMYLGEPDAGQKLVLAKRTSWRRQRTARHGFLAAQEARREIVFWRDTALNRSPVARAGGDRDVECVTPAGTPVLLDGSASLDPDSTPGTRDDIAGFTWTADGLTVGETETVSVDLAPGDHSVELAVEDVLGARGHDGATVRVRDTTAPDVAVELEPVVSGRLFEHAWRPLAQADDRCEGPIEPALLLRLPAGASRWRVRFRPGRAAAVEVWRQHGSPLVVLQGADEAGLRELWSRTAASGGFGLTRGDPIVLIVDRGDRRGPPRPVLRYELDDSGRLQRALASDTDADFEVEATAHDTAGNQGDARVSLRETIAGLCAELPANMLCAPRVGRLR